MPLNIRGSKNIRNFNTAVSYKINDTSGKFLDARNVYPIQDRLDTRHGTSRFNDTSLGGKVLSVSYFTKSDGSRHTIAKVGAKFYDVAESGASAEITFIPSGSAISETSIHRGVTDNDRHIIAIEGEDYLYSWDGTTFSQLGQAAPSAPTATIANGGSLTTAKNYKVAISYYASSIGFETNYSESNTVLATSPNLKIDLTNIPIVAANAFIDKVYIYLKNVTADGSYLFVGEVSLGTSTYSIDAESTSTLTPQTKNDIPGKNATAAFGGGGGKYLAVFNSKLVYAGHSGAPNEVYFSEQYLPDAFDSTDTATVIPVPGNGPVTGLAVGLFGDSVLDPFLVIFKRKSVRIYSEILDQPKLVVLSEEIGCVSHDTISVKNGVVYFLSEEGWRGVANGRLITDKQGDAITLANGDIDDIFKSTGYEYGVNRNGLQRAFSVYYPTLDQYITWLSEASNNAYTKAYAYCFNAGGFLPYEFAVPATCATIGEDSSGRDQVLIGTSDGYILKHSINEENTDTDSTGASVAINAFAILPWTPEDGDFDATYNYRELILKAINSENELTVKTFIDYRLNSSEDTAYDFSNGEGFILDTDSLDTGTLGGARGIVTARSDINRVGESLAIGFYQSILGANIGLVSMQVDSSKNGNRNKASDEEDSETFDEVSGSYFPSASDAVQQCADYLQQIQNIVNTFDPQSVPAGGNAGEFLAKNSAADYDTVWTPDGSLINALIFG